MEVAGEQEAAAAMGSSKEGENLMGPPTFTELENGRFKCVETGHELLDKDKDSYSHSKRCRLGLIDFALSHNNPPLNMFKQDPASRSKLICKLTGDKVNKTEEHIWKHMNGKRFLNKLEQKETGKLVSNGGKVDKESRRNSDGSSKKKKKKKAKKVEEIISEVRESADKESDLEEAEKEINLKEVDFWIPPVGERWDFDDGGDRWGSDSESGEESDGENGTEGAVEDSGKESEELSARTKRMSIEIGPSSFASRKKKTAIITSLKDIIEDGLPPNWQGSDPCGDQWEGIECSRSRVTTIRLSSMGLMGSLSGDISGLSELQTLDLSNNKDLKGSLPSSIGNLNKLTNLILVGCSLSGPIPDSIGSLQQLVFLSLNSNSLNGKIPASIGNLSKLLWLDLTDNQLDGTIPVSDGVSPGLDMLVHTKHFHLGKNKLSGHIPEKLFSSDMELIHVLFDSNQLTGPLPSSLGLVKTLEVVRFDRNFLSGTVPSNLNNLSNLNALFLSNNELTGLIPNLTNLTTLSYLDMSNNTFEPSLIPSWFSTLQSLRTLMMDRTELEGEVPTTIFSLNLLQTVDLKQNRLNGTFDIGTSHSSQLQSINLQSNSITAFTDRPGANKDITIILAANPICLESGDRKDYCRATERDSSYSTPPKNCLPTSCSLDQISSPTCMCAHPYTGILRFRPPSNKTRYQNLEQSILEQSQQFKLPVDSVSLSNPRKSQSEYLEISLAVFPLGQDSFNRTGISMIGFFLSNPTYVPPAEFRPLFFNGDPYLHFTGETRKSEKSTSIGIIIGSAAGGCVLLLLLVLVGVYAHCQKRRAEKANDHNPFAHWDPNKSSGSIPQLKGARCFSFEELNKYTNHFSDTNEVGSGGYGKVYRATLPSGQLIAIKRAQQGSMQGALEFKTEIELLSRVHHKNLVKLLGFCFERGEQMLIYEYIPNGSLRDSLSGKSGIILEWVRRLKIALGAARGLSYMHELADPPIIHRDVKSTNILLDERLNAKVADFGLSKPMGVNDKDHISTQVKGTKGYLDPEYFMTNQLTEKSDVYSFGVLMLEILTGRKPIERGKYIVREIEMAMDKKKDLYNLYEFLDPTIGLGTTLKGFEKFVDLSLRCVEESGADRPSMREVVKEIEYIFQLAGLNPNAESEASLSNYDDASKGYQHPYGNESFDYSGGFPVSKIKP